MDDDKRKSPLALLDRYKFVLLVAALGAVLLVWPAAKTETPAENAQPAGIQTMPVRETEAAMEAILSEISGVGRVDVMLTLHSGSELVLAEDAALRYSGNAQAPDSYERVTEPVTASGGVVVRQEIYPQYRGALVVCDGGNNDRVRLAVVNAVSALTGLGTDKIAVVQWGEVPNIGAN